MKSMSVIYRKTPRYSLLYEVAAQCLDHEFRKISCQRPWETPMEASSAVEEFISYLKPAARLLTELALRNCYYKLNNLCILFLPLFVHSGEINITKDTVEQLMRFVSDSDYFSSRSSLLRNVKKISSCGWNSYLANLDAEIVHRFFKCFPELKIIILHEFTTDTILEALANHCPNLEIIDCREDDYCQASGHGFQLLKSLKNLRHVLFNARVDEYDGETKLQLHFSGHDVASLMLALPKLQRFDCPDYILRDAHDFLKDFYSPLTSIKSLHFDGMENHVSNLNIAVQVCPNVECLSLMIQNNEESQVASILTNLSNLKHLNIYFCCGPVSNLKFELYGNKLHVLSIKTPYVTTDDISTLSTYCPNLKCLTMNDYSLSETFFGVNVEDERQLLFPALETLVYRLRDPQGLLLFMHRESKLKRLYAVPSYGDIRMLKILEQLKTGHSYLTHLQILAIPNLQCDRKSLQQLVDAMPSLERVHIQPVDDDDMQPEYLNTVQGRRVVLTPIYETDDNFPPKLLENMYGL